ncbi:MAG: signal peptidase I [Sphaerochaetaceae bacterium]
MSYYLNWIQKVTERKLTQHLQRAALEKAARKQKRTFKGELFSWLDALVFAVVAVLLINQYIFQLFMIPTPSMVDTLLIKDRVFVSKTAYGTEVYPGGPKLFDSRTPLRDDVIVFYNPQYESRGPFFDVLSQIVYMSTLSLVNIDVDEEGNLRERLYVKRAAAMGGDTVTFKEGNAQIQGGGMSAAVDDILFRQDNGLSTAPKRTIDPAMYAGIKAYGALLAYQDSGLNANSPQHLVKDYKAISDYSGNMDYYQVDASRYATLQQIDPSDFEARSTASHYRQGIYVPHGYVLPMGDNRDNSQDGRYFGPVSEENIIGQVRFRFWPFTRFGSIS